MKTIKRLSDKKLEELRQRILNKQGVVGWEMWEKLCLRIGEENLRRMGL